MTAPFVVHENETPLTREAAHHKMIQRALRDAKKNRFRDRDHDPDLDGIWVVLGRGQRQRLWRLVGFHRSRHIRKSTIRRMRKRLRIPAHVVIRILPLGDAARRARTNTLN